MPTLSFFYGIKIQMFWRDHPPPHFHAKARGRIAVIEIQTLLLREGGLPPDSMRLVLEWAKQHQAELLEAWELCSRQSQPQPIAPLP
jgi:Domain of unknown function (DUF4160)